ncbi:MAG: mercuric transporter MerT family protein [Gemmatimonadota bacterium]|nr:mercuric transporter MerT family protein [Gemmatimonadota bacterium]
MPDSSTRTYLAASGGIAAAIGSALCCAGPLVAVSLGVSGAGIATVFEPLRPYFLGATAVFLGVGFWLLRREEQRACEPGTLCASPVARRRMRAMLWVATALAAVFATFPVWSLWIFN